MCVIYIAFDADRERPLTVAANRDEFYSRPTAAAAHWEDFPDIYGGRDLIGGGTWLGVTRGGRFAAVTNYRDPNAPNGTRSRGHLVADFLKAEVSAGEYMKAVEAAAREFSGFNLIAGEMNEKRRDLFYYSNRGSGVRELPPGIYGLSNHLLDTPWPKVARGKEKFASLVASGASTEEYFDLLKDDTLADDIDLPVTGVGPEVERLLSAIFISSPDYGTRCSTLMIFNNALEWTFEERVFF